MNMAPVDWTILLAVLGVLVGGVLMSRGYMKSVADFLAAGRAAGRYLVCMAAGIAALPAAAVAGEHRAFRSATDRSS